MTLRPCHFILSLELDTLSSICFAYQMFYQKLLTISSIICMIGIVLLLCLLLGLLKISYWGVATRWMTEKNKILIITECLLNITGQVYC